MNSHTFARTALAAVLVTGAAPVLAINCYSVVDRNDRVVYQSVRSPVDLSAAGAAARDALRAKGEQLIAMNTRSCPEVDTSNIGGDHKPATVAEIVAGMRPALRYGRPAGVEAADITTTEGGVSTSGLPSGMSLR